MKHSLILAVLLLGGATAKADVITCKFVGANIYAYTTETATLTITDPFTGQSVDHKNVELLIEDKGQFELKENGKVIVTLEQNYKGRDGASDYEYPYSASASALDGTSTVYNGGCESQALLKRGHDSH